MKPLLSQLTDLRAKKREKRSMYRKHAQHNVMKEYEKICEIRNA